MATSSDRVFGPLVRIGHWAGALAFLVAYVTAGRPLPLHTRVGYALAAYAIWRLLWGIVGPSRARFGELFSSPRAYLDDLVGLVTARPIRHQGLGPVGTLLAVAMLLSICAASAAGVVTLAVRHGAGPLAPFIGAVPEELPKAITEYGADGGMTIIPRTDRASVDTGPEHPDIRPGREVKRIHGTLSLLALWLVVIHLVHVLYASLVRGENLLYDMVTGRRAERAPPPPRAPAAAAATTAQVPAVVAAPRQQTARQERVRQEPPRQEPVRQEPTRPEARPEPVLDEPAFDVEADGGSDDERAQRKLMRRLARKERKREARG